MCVNISKDNGWGIVNGSQGIKIWTEMLIPQKVEDILIISGGQGSIWLWGGIRDLVDLEVAILTVETIGYGGEQEINY